MKRNATKKENLAKYCRKILFRKRKTHSSKINFNPKIVIARRNVQNVLMKYTIIEIFDNFQNITYLNKQNVLLYSNVQHDTVNRKRPRNNLGTMMAYAYKFYLIAFGENFLV